MGHRYAAIAFTDSVRETQASLGSRSGYAAMDTGEDHNHRLGEHEAAFIAARDSFYMASVSETGWPYVQHRGGPPGFVTVLDERTIAFADFRGNRQYVTVGNVRKDDRVSLFFMDYPNQARLKLFGRVRLVGPQDSQLLARIEMPDYRAPVERGFIIQVEAFDWNCPQHITPRYAQAEVDALLTPLIEENRLLKTATVSASPPRVLGDGPLELTVSAVRQLTARVRAYELRDPNGADLPEIEAGAHLRVPVQLDDGTTENRHYSISSDPARRDMYEIAVLRDDHGTGGSRALHEQLRVGLRVRAEMPGNYFRLHTDPRPAILIAGGIGITPIKSMAHALNKRGNAVQLHYAARSIEDMAFRHSLSRQLGDDLTTYGAATGERMDIERVLSIAPDDAVFYICGPGRLTDAVISAATVLGIDPERVRFERFNAAPATDAKAIQVELRRSGKQLVVAANQTILDALLDAGVDAPYSCKAGNCRTCAVPVLDGEPDHRDNALSSSEREHLMCPCVSRANSEQLVLDV